MKALVVLHGNITDLSLLKKIGDESDFVLCADGGTDYCIKASLTPDLIIGDLDSISSETLNLVTKNNIPLERFPVKKDKTDSELCIDYLIQKGAQDITLVGAIGSRMDHTLANIFLLVKMRENGVEGKIVNSNNTIYLVTDGLELDSAKGNFISIIPIGLSDAIVTLEGFEYNLNKAEIEFSSTYGISNRIIEDKGHISIHQGQCLVMISRD